MYIVIDEFNNTWKEKELSDSTKFANEDGLLSIIDTENFTVNHGYGWVAISDRRTND